MSWIKIGTREELKQRKVVTVRGCDRRIAVFWNDGEPQAVDNRCPHMGFPLDQGSVQEGILTCHWHHARFALKGGCAFDLYADDVPTFAVREEDGNLEVSDQPETAPTEAYYRKRLRRGLEQNLSLLQAKSIVGLLKSGVPVPDILRQLAEFGCENHEAWADGMTLIVLMAHLDPVLSDKTRVYGICWAARQIAANCSGQPRRRERGALTGANETLDRLQDWFREFVLMRHRDGAERALLTANDLCRDQGDRQRTLAGAILQRVYIDTGHLYDFTNKALELGALLNTGKEDFWPKILPLLIPEAVEGRGEEDRAAWRNPFDLISAIRSAEAELKDIPPGRDAPPPDLRDILLGGNSGEILGTLVRAIKSQADPGLIAREIALAAAWRLAHFAPSNDLGDWFTPVHGFIYANAVVQTFKRSPSAELYPALLHGAMTVFQDRFLNVPAGAYPKIPAAKESLDPELPGQLLKAMDHAPNPREVVAMAVRWIRSGGSIDRLTDCLAWAAIREDLDFHKIQAIEAAFQLSKDTDGIEDRALLFAGAARYLAAHCPTPRSRQQSTRTALALHRGESLGDLQQ
ncbi:MAG TPA: Rieske (2Fe-2S) protein [Chthoniobacteraceae bacterium]|nr:Rieske (2Fe-2S) protein [Chthoniobacteraceae bacterium]